MIRWFPPCCIALPFLAGCVAMSPSTVRVAAADQAIASAAAQVRRCYHDPVAPSVARRIITRLRVRYAENGNLIGPPEIVSQEGVSPVNQAYAGRMAEAARLSVIRCSPLHLPVEAHRGGWDEFDLIFGRSAMV
jgi:hypothetical protein